MGRMSAITLRFFAAARELAGASTATLPWEARAPLSALRAALAEAYPRLAPHLPRMRFAVDEVLVGEDATVAPGALVDLLPPVAGGAAVALCSVRSEPLSIDAVYRAVSRPAAGGVALFVGVVRDHADGQPVARLDYEAHPTLADKALRAALEEAAAQVPGAVLAATHRVGTLAVGDLAVVVGASAPHRAEAFEACRHAIEAIKRDVPIWKHEWDAEGRAHWVNLE